MTNSKHATLRYSALRLGIFAICLAVLTGLSLLGWIPSGIGTSNPFWLLALAIVISAPISFVVLNRQREAMAQQVGGAVERGVGRARTKLHANRSMEDDADDAARSTTAEGRGDTTPEGPAKAATPGDAATGDSAQGDSARDGSEAKGEAAGGDAVRTDSAEAEESATAGASPRRD